MDNNLQNKPLERLPRGGFCFITFVSAVFGAFAMDTESQLVFVIDSLIGGSLFLTAVIGRLHDINKNGYYSLLMLVPYVNCIFFLVLLFKRGTIGPNDYDVKLSSDGIGIAKQTDAQKQMMGSLSKDEQLKQALKGNHPYRNMKSYNRG